MDEPRERWVGSDAGPTVRPYALIRGRAGSQGAQGTRLDLITILVATGRVPGRVQLHSREQRRMLELCAVPVTLADLASDLELPFHVVRLLAGELVADGLIAESREQEAVARHSPELLRTVLNELNRL
ncbi:DUF742 domain-containing protein [Actinocorallia longicatena]|uniref:DUF742 domain-containing protein n=1 Tax=Actinocorallia longicatena TaxID=111803 RepID=A0ABP6Q4H1_9ACTN